MRGLRPQASQLRAAVGGQEAVVCRVQQAPHGGSELSDQGAKATADWECGAALHAKVKKVTTSDARVATDSVTPKHQEADCHVYCNSLDFSL